MPLVSPEIEGEQGVNRFSGLEITLGSRIAVVGENFGNTIDLLLGTSDVATGTFHRHDGLLVLHLGPRLLLDTAEHTAGQYLAAFTASLKQRPHVVILDEAACSGNEAWGQAFHFLLDSKAMRKFQGALLICVAEETLAIRRICKHRWTGTAGNFRQEVIEEHDNVDPSQGTMAMQCKDALDERPVQNVQDSASQKNAKEDSIELVEVDDSNSMVPTLADPLASENIMLIDARFGEASHPNPENSDLASIPSHVGRMGTPSKESTLPCGSIKHTKAVHRTRFLEVDPASAEVQASEQHQILLASVQELWSGSGFSGTCVNFLAKHKEVMLTLLVQAPASDNIQNCMMGDLVGFLVYRINHPQKYMSIRRLAIMPKFRRQGHGRQFIDWCIRQAGVSFISATSVARSVDFYLALRFRKAETWHTGGVVRPDDEPEGNQVYMEYHPMGSKKGKGGRNKKR